LAPVPEVAGPRVGEAYECALQEPKIFVRLDVEEAFLGVSVFNECSFIGVSSVEARRIFNAIFNVGRWGTIGKRFGKQ